MIPNLRKPTIQTWTKFMKKSFGKVMTDRKTKVKKGSHFYKTNTLVLSKKYMFLNTRGLEEVSYSKSSFSRLIFCNQHVVYVSGITLSNDKYKRKNSHNMTVRNCCRTHVNFFKWVVGVSQICAPLSFISWYFFKSQPVILCLNDFCYHRTVDNLKNIWRNLTIEQYFRAVLKMGPEPRKTSVTVKWLLWCSLISSEACLL